MIFKIYERHDGARTRSFVFVEYPIQRSASYLAGRSVVEAGLAQAPALDLASALALASAPAGVVMDLVSAAVVLVAVFLHAYALLINRSNRSALALD